MNFLNNIFFDAGLFRGRLTCEVLSLRFFAPLILQNPYKGKKCERESQSQSQSLPAPGACVRRKCEPATDEASRCALLRPEDADLFFFFSGLCRARGKKEQGGGGASEHSPRGEKAGTLAEKDALLSISEEEGEGEELQPEGAKSPNTRRAGAAAATTPKLRGVCVGSHRPANAAQQSRARRACSRRPLSASTSLLLKCSPICCWRVWPNHLCTALLLWAPAHARTRSLFRAVLTTSAWPAG